MTKILANILGRDDEYLESDDDYFRKQWRIFSKRWRIFLQAMTNTFNTIETHTQYHNIEGENYVHINIQYYLCAKSLSFF